MEKINQAKHKKKCREEGMGSGTLEEGRLIQTLTQSLTAPLLVALRLHMASLPAKCFVVMFFV